MEGHPSHHHVHHREEGPVESSHYEDSSDDDHEAVGVQCDDGRLRRPHYSRNNSNNTSAMESGISTSGQVDDGNFRLVPNNVEDERFNQFNPPRSQPEPSASSSSSSSTASTSRASTSHHHNEAAINTGTGNADQPLFCEPGSSRPRNNGITIFVYFLRKKFVKSHKNFLLFFSGVNNQQQQPTASSGSRNNGNLDYEIDALDNFPDPASGDFDPTNSLSSSFPGSHPVDLEDIQVQGFAPEHFHKHVDHHQASEANAATGVSSASSQSTASQHIMLPQQVNINIFTSFFSVKTNLNLLITFKKIWFHEKTGRKNSNF